MNFRIAKFKFYHRKLVSIESVFLYMVFIEVSVNSISCITIDIKNTKLIGTVIVILVLDTATAWKVFKYGVFSGPHFLLFRQVTEIYWVNLHIQSILRKLQRKNSLFWHFLCSVLLSKLIDVAQIERFKSNCPLRIFVGVLIWIAILIWVSSCV